ncbi:CAP domain-containing protein [soil metagenome]
MNASAVRRSLGAALMRSPWVLVALVTVVLVAAGLLTVRSGIFSDPDPVAGGRDNRCWRSKSPERAFAKKMNKARRRTGAGRMKLDPELSKVARVHTREMTKRNLLHHTSSSSLRRRVIGWATLGENVGVGNTVRSLHKAFMNSPGHRRNILYGSFRYSGVGVRSRGGRMWVTVVFEASRNPGTRLKMPRC